MHLYDEFVDFLVENLNPQVLAKFESSAGMKVRVAELAAREKAGGLPPAEQRELDHFRTVEVIVGLAKTRMKQRLISE